MSEYNLTWGTYNNMKVHGFVMVTNSVFEQLENDKCFNKRSGRGLSLITDRSFNEFYLGLGNSKPDAQSEKST